jgi:hypothetical protein
MSPYVYIPFSPPLFKIIEPRLGNAPWEVAKKAEQNATQMNIHNEECTNGTPLS